MANEQVQATPHSAPDLHRYLGHNSPQTTAVSNVAAHKPALPLAGAGAVSLHPRLCLPGGQKAGCARPSHRPESRLVWHLTRPKAVRPGPDGPLC